MALASEVLYVSTSAAKAVLHSSLIRVGVRTSVVPTALALLVHLTQPLKRWAILSRPLRGLDWYGSDHLREQSSTSHAHTEGSRHRCEALRHPKQQNFAFLRG